MGRVIRLCQTCMLFHQWGKLSLKMWREPIFRQFYGEMLAVLSFHLSTQKTLDRKKIINKSLCSTALPENSKPAPNFILEIIRCSYRSQSLVAPNESMQQRCLPSAVFCACLSADRIVIIHPQGIAMPKGLYFTLVVFFTPNLWGHWTDLNQTWLHIHLWLLGDKNDCGNQLWTLTEHISATEHDINNWKDTYQSTGTPLHAPKFGELWSRNGWIWLASFCPTS